MGADISASIPPAFVGELVGQAPHRPQKGDVEGEFHRVIPVRPIVLEEPGVNPISSPS
jgi:hypothetical protein